MEKATKSNETLLRCTLNAIQDGILVLGRDLSVVRHNTKLADWLGRSMVGEKCYKAIWGKDKPCDGCQSIKAMKERCSSSRIVNPNLLDGEIAWVCVSSYPLIDDAGKVIGAVEHARDITESKRAEDALLESENRYVTLLNAASISGQGIVVLQDAQNKKGALAYANLAASNITGYSLTELGQMCWQDVVALKDRLASEKRYKRRMQGEYIRDIFELSLLRKDGTDVPVEVAAVLTEFQSRKASVTLFRDISGRKRAEEKLGQMIEKYSGILENIGIGVALISPDMRVVELNRQMRTWFPKIDPREKPLCYEAFNEPSRDRLCNHCPVVKTLRDGEVHQAITETPTEEREKNYRIVSSPIHDNEGNITGVIKMVEDLRDLFKLEEQQMSLQRMEALGTLAGGIAHDFNNILSVIFGVSELALADSPEESQSYERLQEILRASCRAKELVRQILTFSRQSPQDLKPLEIAPIVKETIKFLKSSLPSTIDIVYQIDNDTGVVEADPTQIHQILMNLCTNAAHAMREKGGTLKVSLARLAAEEKPVDGLHSDRNASRFLRLTVSDTGHGMEPHVLERIFEPYFTTKAVGEGTGLGLAVVHGIVKSLGGVINVCSEPDHGCTFHVDLPLLQHEAERDTIDESPLRTGRETVLFVDDEKPMVELGKGMLERLGYKVMTKTNSFEALDLFRNRPDAFDLVVTDMTMPGMTGDDLARELLKIRADLPVILCTGYSERITAESAKELGIRGILMKPFSMREMGDAMRCALGQ
jgi:PAS domain S-box-containing protein